MLGKICIINLLECNLNFGLKWAFAWRLGSFTEKRDLYNHSQHSLSGKWCHTPVLNKTLTFDLLMQTHHDEDFGDCDAITSFDQLTMSLMILLALAVVSVIFHAVCCYNMFQSMEYSIFMVHDPPPSSTPPRLSTASKVLHRAVSSPLSCAHIAVTSSSTRLHRMDISLLLITPQNTVNDAQFDTVINS